MLCSRAQVSRVERKYGLNFTYGVMLLVLMREVIGWSFDD